MFIILFIAFTALNVILSTARSLITVKGTKTGAAAINALAYGLYTYLVVLTASDGIDIWAKMIITAVCNFVGVYVVKLIEEKMRKDKLWRVEATFATNDWYNVDYETMGIPHSFIRLNDKYTVFTFYCATQADSQRVKDIIKAYNAKYFASETKIL